MYISPIQFLSVTSTAVGPGITPTLQQPPPPPITTTTTTTTPSNIGTPQTRKSCQPPELGLEMWTRILSATIIADNDDDDDEDAHQRRQNLAHLWLSCRRVSRLLRAAAENVVRHAVLPQTSISACRTEGERERERERRYVFSVVSVGSASSSSSVEEAVFALDPRGCCVGGGAAFGGWRRSVLLPLERRTAFIEEGGRAQQQQQEKEEDEEALGQLQFVVKLGPVVSHGVKALPGLRVLDGGDGAGAGTEPVVAVDWQRLVGLLVGGRR